MKEKMPTGMSIGREVSKKKRNEKRQMQVVLAIGEPIHLFGIGGSLEKFARHIERKGLYVRNTIQEKTTVRFIPPHSIREIRWNEKAR